LKKTAATEKQLDEARIQLRKLYVSDMIGLDVEEDRDSGTKLADFEMASLCQDTLNIEHLELKTHVWGLGK
jgi:hypothetical protein